ncbi:diphthamide biosynthesis protein [Trichocladium antarcticum]|uniref:2-(3-amino-3-carboxypropyl)histidine synthase subunit 2 n=1 Tax=Trichocladium antarcticum TaxID=1450529 RepID=A0AAN6UCQ1_9PEZI|nr:diphthamide biosynthesis protein [Trichocladium antarcticum]
MAELSAAPVLSTPAEYLFEHTVTENKAPIQRRTDDELRNIYEVARAAQEIRQGGWKRIALQFPDHMLRDAPRVVQALNTELASIPRSTDASGPPERIYILADTSYSSCCVDEIAAEHVDADVVVHYGRSCLSPTSRLPVIYIFTHHDLDHQETVAAFEQQYPDKQTPAILMADVTYQDHIPALASELFALGYTNLVSTAIIHDPTGQIPNRKLVHPQTLTDLPTPSLHSHSIFHVSSPPTSLLLALSSRVAALHIHPTALDTTANAAAAAAAAAPTSTPRLLGRRYARVLTLATAGIVGILVNTLSVSNYLASVDTLRRQLAARGKKSYTVVVGKLNAAKLANFAEVDGWVVVGCWESALVEEDAGFYRPVVTPFELGVALMGDGERVWGGEWWGGIERVGIERVGEFEIEGEGGGGGERGEGDEGDDSEEESAPPEFDLRTGRLVSHGRPMKKGAAKVEKKKDEGRAAGGNPPSGGALALRPKAELAMVNGVVSPGAEYLRSQRTWQGLGSDYVAEESTAIEEGRGGVARGYTVGGDQEKR